MRAPPNAPALGTPAAAGPVAALRLQHAMLWLLMLSSFFVRYEPSPYELVFLAAFAVFSVTGLRLHASLAPLIALLVVFNLGGLLSVVPVAHDRSALVYTAVTVYLSLTSLFFAACLLDDAARRIEIIKSGYVAAAALAALGGIAGYFDIAGLGDFLTLYNRAASTFKDPNVFGTFLILPIALLAQDLLLGRRRVLLHGALLMLLVFGLFLSFSRGAWANLVLTLVLLALLTFLTTAEAWLRTRIVLLCIAGAGMLAVGLAAALSIEGIRAVFEIRASLGQDYDLGETGRFGNQLRGIQLLLEHPNGLGPHQFGKLFGQDPHNVYLNAFSAYGWLGGFSFLAIIALTLAAGLRTVLTRSPLQGTAIAVYAPLVAVILQGMQIDTDHWRHFYLLLGLTWGLYGATTVHRTRRPSPR